MKFFSEYRGLRRELYILFIGRMMTNMGSMIWPMFTLILSEKLGFNATDIALYMLVYSLAALPISLAGGKLADKYNKKNIIVICDCISIVSYIYCSLVEITVSAIVIFAVASLFQSVEWPSYDALVADFTSTKDRERAYSLSYLGGNLGMVLSPTVGGILFNSHLNLAFLISGLSIALSTVLIALLIKDVHREDSDDALTEYEQDIDDKISPFAYIAKNRVVLLYLFVSLIGNGVYCMWDYIMPLQMADVHLDKGPVLYGTMTTLNCLTVITCTALITKLFRKVIDSDKMFLGELLQGTGFLLFALFVKNIFICYAAIFIFTLGEIFNTLGGSPFLTRRIPASHRGRIMSVMSVFTSLGSVLIQNAAGRIYDRRGADAAWMFTLALACVVLIILTVLKRFDKKDFSLLHDKKDMKKE